MAIWMDMTNTLRVWQGNCTGIVRAELEFAKNLKKINSELRFCVAYDNDIREVPPESLKWLFEADEPTDAYNTHFQRKTVAGKEILETNNVASIEKSSDMPAGLAEAMRVSDGRIERIRAARELLISSFSGFSGKFVMVTTAMVYYPIKALSVVRARIKKFSKKFIIKIKEVYKPKKTEKTVPFSHPFAMGDVIFACGWFTGGKERLYSRVKTDVSNIKLVWMIYDLMLLKKNLCQLYNEYITTSFAEYVAWIANNCDSVIYGGRTAQKDAEEYFSEHHLQICRGYVVKFGSDIYKKTVKDAEAVLRKFSLNKSDYILSVGTLDAKKNYMTIYKAYYIAKRRYDQKDIPQLVIAGGSYESNIVIELFEKEPFISKKVRIIHPNDEELSVLYKFCKFTILPSVYEGWSLTLPEALDYGKFCLCSDVAPLREIAGDLVDYVETFDASAWADAIVYYFQNSSAVEKYSARIIDSWHPISWHDCSVQLNRYLLEINSRPYKKGKIYYDFTLAFSMAYTGAYVSGILRTQLLLARYLNRMIPDMRFVAFIPQGYIEIDKYSLMPLFSDNDIESAFQNMRQYLLAIWREIAERNENSNNDIKKSAWLTISVLPRFMQKFIIDNYYMKFKKTAENQETYDIPLFSDSLVFSAGTGFDLNVYKKILKEKESKGFRFIQLIYDLTPILLPQLHRQITVDYYKPFLNYTSKISDAIFYGGETAKSDGIKYEEENNLPVREGVAIKFGSNIAKNNGEITKKEVLKKYGINRKYVIAVGSIEIRKNHETLYMAYLDMMEKTKDLPQLIFCGYPGWKTEEFYATFNRDKRVKKNVIIITPSDTELDILYRNCEFTVLASLYEGWSLTLPESLSYGKFCIASDVEPLKETGKDFIDYVEPYDMKAWSKKILYYHQNPEILREKEMHILKDWKPISWEDCARQIVHELEKKCKDWEI